MLASLYYTAYLLLHNCPPLLKNMVHVTYFSEFAEFILECMNLHLEATNRHVLFIDDYEKVARITERVQD